MGKIRAATLAEVVTVYLDDQASDLALTNKHFGPGLRAALEQAWQHALIAQRFSVSCTWDQVHELDAWFRATQAAAAARADGEMERVCSRAQRSIRFAIRRGGGR